MNGGPLGLLLGYVFIATICLAMMVSSCLRQFEHASPYPSSQLSLGEMTTFLPLPGGFIKLADRFIDPAFAFATGWNYWYQWTVRLAPSNLACSLIMGRS